VSGVSTGTVAPVTLDTPGWISRHLPSPIGAEFSDLQVVFLRMPARRTWGFFETFVGPDSNWLPPDNYQEEPILVVANGTSPTNMGLYLLSSLAAHDFGYISTGVLIERLGRTLRAMGNLDRFHSHFYNYWYSTRELFPLQPLYVSTVDSGNLAGHLLTLKWGI